MDPITMALIAQGIAGIGKAGYGAYQAKQGKKALNTAFKAPTSKPSEYAKMLLAAQSGELEKRKLDAINQSLGTATDTLAAGGQRALIGGIGSVVKSGADAKTSVLEKQREAIRRALEQSAQGSEAQRSRDVNRQIREEKQAQAAIEGGISNITSGLGDVLSAGVGYGTADAQGLIGKNKTDEFIDEDFFEGKNGMKVKKTKGKFSHKENPIHMVQKGEKVGEVTGGEYIFNPKQAKQLKEYARSGNSDLHKFVRSLLNKKQFK